jgi:hypothetical protein
MHIFVLLSIISSMLSNAAYGLPYPIANALENEDLILDIPNLLLKENIIDSRQLTDCEELVKLIIQSAQDYQTFQETETASNYLVTFTDAIKNYREFILRLDSSSNILNKLKALNIYIPSIIYELPPK